MHEERPTVLHLKIRSSFTAGRLLQQTRRGYSHPPMVRVGNRDCPINQYVVVSGSSSKNKLAPMGSGCRCVKCLLSLPPHQLSSRYTHTQTPCSGPQAVKAIAVARQYAKETGSEGAEVTFLPFLRWGRIGFCGRREIKAIGTQSDATFLCCFGNASTLPVWLMHRVMLRCGVSQE